VGKICQNAPGRGIRSERVLYLVEIADCKEKVILANQTSKYPGLQYIFHTIGTAKCIRNLLDFGS
jgi:hypothetical protein